MNEPLTPAAEISAARQARIDGTMNERDFHAVMERAGTQLNPGDSASDLKNAGMTAEVIHQLKHQRIAGAISELEYHRQMAQLGPLMTGEAVPPQGNADPFERQIDEVMASAKPEDYHFSYATGSPSTPEALALDTDIRSAMSETGIPKQLGGPIVDAVKQVALHLEQATPAARDVHVEAFQSEMRKQWGADFDSRRDAVSALVAEMAEKRPGVAELIDSAPWLIADVRVANYLWTVAEHRARRRT